MFFYFKRVFDLIIAFLFFVLVLPLLFIASLSILIIDLQSPFFIQERSGLYGKKINIYKLKTMKFINGHKKVTILGKILRLSKIDELPQLINVLNKDMSLVGPRPLPEEIEKKIANSIKIKRRNILPGITGMSQINYTGKNRKLDQKINLDLQYIDNYNLYNYFKILLKTPLVLVSRFFKNKSSIIK